MACQYGPGRWADLTRGDIERVVAAMTTTPKAEHPTTRQQRLGAALRDNLRRRKAQARNRAHDANAPAVTETEGGDTRHESEADC
jgi:hypothetical protein